MTSRSVLRRSGKRVERKDARGNFILEEMT